jgi:NADP-dependent 3-hydroxy acid dehydrogenase YdfG
MSEHVAVVAGAGGELGRAAEENLAVAAFTVAGIDRSDQALKQLPDGIWRETADPADPFTTANSRGGL